MDFLLPVVLLLNWKFKELYKEGRKLSSMPDVKYKNYTDAIEQILQDDSIAVLLSDDEIMTITVIGPDGQQSEKILSGIEACTMRQGNVYCYFVTPEEVASAHETVNKRIWDAYGNKKEGR